MTTQHEALTKILSKVGRLDSRLLGRRPHPNDISWAKQIVNDIRKIAEDATNLTKGN